MEAPPDQELPQGPSTTIAVRLPQGTIEVPDGTVPEGRLVLQVDSDIEVLTPTDAWRISFEDPRIYAYGVSAEGGTVVAASYVSEPTHYTRQDRLLAIDLSTGAHTTLVRASPTENLGPAIWSPDGTRVAYRLGVLSVDPAEEHPGDPIEQRVCIVTVATSTSRCSPDLRTVDDFSWSPDGGRIVVDGVGAELPLRLFDPDSDRVSDFASPLDPDLLTALGGTPPDSFVFASWSAGGSYVATQAHLRAVAIFDREGRFVMLGHETTEFSDVLAWSPNQDRLAYAIGRPPYSINDVFVLDPANGEDRLLFSTGHGEHAPIVTDAAWSPSGRWLAVALTERTSFGPKSIHIIDVTGTEPVSVVELGPSDGGNVVVGWGP